MTAASTVWSTFPVIFVTDERAACRSMAVLVIFILAVELPRKTCFPRCRWGRFDFFPSQPPSPHFASSQLSATPVRVIQQRVIASDTERAAGDIPGPETERVLGHRLGQLLGEPRSAHPHELERCGAVGAHRGTGGQGRRAA